MLQSQLFELLPYWVGFCSILFSFLVGFTLFLPPYNIRKLKRIFFLVLIWAGAVVPVFFFQNSTTTSLNESTLDTLELLKSRHLTESETEAFKNRLLLESQFGTRDFVYFCLHNPRYEAKMKLPMLAFGYVSTDFQLEPDELTRWYDLADSKNLEQVDREIEKIEKQLTAPAPKRIY